MEFIKITQAVAYFHSGECFTNVQMQTFAENRLGFLNLYSIVNAKTPFRLTIADIRYINKEGKRGMAEEFSLIVY